MHEFGAGAVEDDGDATVTTQSSGSALAEVRARFGVQADIHRSSLYVARRTQARGGMNPAGHVDHGAGEPSPSPRSGRKVTTRGADRIARLLVLEHAGDGPVGEDLVDGLGE